VEPGVARCKPRLDHLPLCAAVPVETRIESLPVGWTPLIPAQRLARQLGMRSLLIKDDGRNPSSSFKDRATAIALLRARELGLDS